MARGDVWVADVDLPDKQDPTKIVPTRKYVVELQSGALFDHLRDVAVVLVSTLRNQTPKAWNVFVGPADGFSVDSVIDGRWVFTIPRARLDGAQHLTTLTAGVMEQVSEAIAVGLQLT